MTTLWTCLTVYVASLSIERACVLHNVVGGASPHSEDPLPNQTVFLNLCERLKELPKRSGCAEVCKP